MSPFHVFRQFHAVFGDTPHQFRIHAVVDRAKQLLAISDYSVTDVWRMPEIIERGEAAAEEALRTVRRAFGQSMPTSS